METHGSTYVESICIPSKQLNVNLGISYNSHQVKEMNSSLLEHAIKARKPYTITKQRERWSEEEHEKFLEALKLYGRAWRQIEEHIGTKTAVQIRSHAQKFFSKVAHDSAVDGSGSVKAIAIPPPRPKRKPVHPYPRKISHPHSLKMPISEQPEWSHAPIPSPLEQENRSPMSVLAPSDAAGSSVSNLPSCSTSPLSSRAGSNQVEMFHVGENRSLLPVASSEEEDRSPSPGLNNATMESGTGVKDNGPRDEDSSMETQAQTTTLKLFGRTVLVTDSQKRSSSDGASLRCLKPAVAIDIQSHDRTADTSPQTVAQSMFQKIDGDVSGFPGQSAWIPWPGQMIPMVYCSPCGDSVRAAEGMVGSSMNSMPWCWALYGASPFQFSNVSCNQNPSSQHGGSWNESASLSSPTPATSLTSIRRSANSTFNSFPTGVSMSPRGFKPYKRCLAQKVALNLSTEDNEAIKLCL